MTHGETSGETSRDPRMLVGRIAKALRESTRRGIDLIIQGIKSGDLVPLTITVGNRIPPGSLVLAPRHVANEVWRQFFDAAVFAGALVKGLPKGPRLETIDLSKVWREAINVDPASPDQVSRFRRRFGLSKIVPPELRVFKQFVRRLERATGLNPRSFTKEQKDALERAALHGDRVGGIGVIYEALWRDISGVELHNGSGVRTCRFCNDAFVPEGSVTDCCPQRSCRGLREAERKRIAYHNKPGEKAKAKRRVYAFRRRIRNP